MGCTFDSADLKGTRTKRHASGEEVLYGALNDDGRQCAEPGIV